MAGKKTFKIDATGVVLTHITGKTIEIDKFKIDRRGKIDVLVITPRGGEKVEIALWRIDDALYPLKPAQEPEAPRSTRTVVAERKHKAPAPAVVTGFKEDGADVVIQLVVPKNFALHLLAPGDKTVKISTTMAVLDVVPG